MNNNNFNQNVGQPMQYQQNQNVNNGKGKKSKKVILIIVGVFVAIFVAAIAIIAIIASTSSKMVCTSDQGDITILYNENRLTGYTANGIDYDFTGQSAYADEVGTKAYVEEFKIWFETNTTGSCTIEEK